jgi:predicted permease
VLVTLEVALATLLLTSAILFLTSFWRASSIGLGFNPRNVLTVRLRPLVLPGVRPPGRDPLFRVLERVEQLPGVDAAALTTGGLPLRGDLTTFDFEIPDQPGVKGDISRNAVSPAYFQVLDIPLVRGRGFDASDGASAQPVMILNARAADRFFGGTDAVGRMVRWKGESADRLIVGIAGDIRYYGPESATRPQAFIPLRQANSSAATLVIRTSTTTRVLPDVGRAVSAEYSTAAMPPLSIDVQTLDHYYASILGPRRLNMWVLGMFGVLGATIAGVGIYGVITYLVAQRTREIGIRLALGAHPPSIIRAVLARTLVYVLVGLAAGLTIGWLVSTSAESLLFQVHPHERWVYGLVALSLLTIAGVGAIIPARRATRIDPLAALRLE